MLKHLGGKMKLIDALLTEEGKIIDSLFKECKAVIDKMMSKKEITKRQSFEKGKASNFEEIKRAEIQTTKNDCIGKLDHLKGIFESHYERIQKNNEEMKSHYDSIFQVWLKGSIENYAKIKE
jgi:hypothetical protein